MLSPPATPQKPTTYHPSRFEDAEINIGKMGRNTFSKHLI
jgi:hypothetical protein